MPNLYYLATSLPIKVNTSSLKIYYDCKIRRLFVHASKIAGDAIPEEPEEAEVEEVEEAPAAVSEEQEVKEDKAETRYDPDLDDDVIEIDTDEHFGRHRDPGKKQTVFKKPVIEEVKEINTDDLDMDEDMLYDLC